ncbi:hypothetical protein LBMAG57_15250 [Verrucomicrobiota bacterium]|jgi:hypothetical protein|nr:hypothetical protein LBMAG57_15250 [Verrucomicrobiota bacterium]
MIRIPDRRAFPFRSAAPAAVRYAWASNPLLSVENSAGLPLRTFRTDRGSGK